MALTERKSLDRFGFKTLFKKNSAVDHNHNLFYYTKRENNASFSERDVRLNDHDNQLADIYTKIEDYWDDMRFPFTQSKLGVLDKPDFDETNLGLLFPRNDTTEIAFVVAQLPHTYIEGTNLSPHLHWIQANSNTVVWKMAYKWYNNGEAFPAGFTTLTNDNLVFPYTSGNLSQISGFPDLDGTDKKISSIILIKIWRDDDVAAGWGMGDDALGIEFDLHYKSNTYGTEEEFHT